MHLVCLRKSLFFLRKRKEDNILDLRGAGCQYRTFALVRFYGWRGREGKYLAVRLVSFYIDDSSMLP